MSAFAKQSRNRGQKPIIYNVCNCAKAPEGQPTLLTWDEVCTLFHEFGHALHGMLSDCEYNTLSGTSVWYWRLRNGPGECEGPARFRH